MRELRLSLISSISFQPLLHMAKATGWADESYRGLRDGGLSSNRIRVMDSMEATEAGQRTSCTEQKEYVNVKLIFLQSC
jgi:hypothetical protein